MINRSPAIISTHNDRVRAAKALRRSRERRRRHLTLVESYRLLDEAVRHGWSIDEVFYTPTGLTEIDAAVLEAAGRRGAHLIPTTRAVLRDLSKREEPMGCVATIRVEERHTLDTIEVTPTSLFMVAETIEKPGNLGVICRTSSAVGASAVIVVDRQTDVWDPATVHASLGAVFSLPVVVTTTASCAQWLAVHGIRTLVTTPQNARSYAETDMTGPLAVVAGNEHRGVADSWLSFGQPVMIPMVGPMNSLNVSVAAAVLLFEARRRRMSDPQQPAGQRIMAR